MAANPPAARLCISQVEKAGSVSQTEISLDRPVVVLAAAATGTAAVLVFALLPIISGVMAEQYQLSDVQVGLVASAYFSVYALIALSSSLWIRRLDWNIAKRAGFAGMLAGLLLCVFAGSFELACTGLAVVGAGAGMLFPISLTVVSDMEHTDRTYAIKISAEQLVPAGLLFLLSSALFAGYGQTQLLLALVALVILCLVLSHGLPSRGNPAAHTTAATGSSAALAILSLAALAVNFAGFAGLWAFLERIGAERGFEPGFIATWLGVGLVTSGIGPLGAAFLEDRFGRALPLLVASCLALLSLPLLTGEIDRLDYALVLFALPLVFYFAITYILSVIAEADHRG